MALTTRASSCQHGVRGRTLVSVRCRVTARDFSNAYAPVPRASSPTVRQRAVAIGRCCSVITAPAQRPADPQVWSSIL